MPHNKYAYPAAPSAFEDTSKYPKIVYIKNDPRIPPWKQFVDLGSGPPYLSKDCYDRLSAEYDLRFSNNKT